MFQNSLNGLNTFSYALDVVGHDLSNSENVGYKKTNLHFSDSFVSAMGNAYAAGATEASSVANFGQGTVTDTGNPLDLAISGNGFFQISRGRTASAGDTFYTRNGQFRLEIESYASSGENGTRNSYITDGNGNYLMGWNAGVASTAPTAPITISQNTSAGSPSTSVGLGLNLDSGAEPPSNPDFDPANARTYNWATTVQVYDSSGSAHDLTTYYAKSEQANTWNVYARLDGLEPVEGGGARPLVFSATGSEPVTTPMTYNFTLSGGASMSAITVDLGASTQYGNNFSRDQTSVNGYATGNLKKIHIDTDGTIYGDYTNGTTASLGRVALTRFTSPEGLAHMGGNLWQATAKAGTLEIWPDPATANASTASRDKLAGWGSIRAGAVEKSTVDSAEDMVDLITMQRNYQANAKGIETQDQMLQSLLSIR